MSKEEIEKQITDILYKNSNDDSECLIIKFENINKVIQLLVSVLKQPKSEAKHPFEDYKKQLDANCDEHCFYNCSQGGSIKPQCLSQQSEANEAMLMQSIKEVLYETAKKTEHPEGGFLLSIQFEEQAKALLNQFTITRNNK